MPYDDDKESELDEADEDDESADILPCPQCGKDIYEDTDRCPHCGQWVMPLASNARRNRTGWIVVTLLLVLIILSWSIL